MAICVYTYSVLLYIYMYTTHHQHTPPAHTPAHTTTHRHTHRHTPPHTSSTHTSTRHHTPDTPPAYTPARTTGGEGVWHSARRAISRERGLSRFEGRNANPLIIRYNTDFRGTRQYKGYVSQTLNNQRVIGEYK